MINMMKRYKKDWNLEDEVNFGKFLKIWNKKRIEYFYFKRNNMNHI